MLKSFLFVPANNQKFIKKSTLIFPDYIVYDLEDSVLTNEFDNCVELLSSQEINNNSYVRFRFFTSDDNNLNSKDFRSLIELGFRNFIIPKYNDISQLENISNFIKKHYCTHIFNFILLIESPIGLLSLYESLKSNILNISGIGIGSHDYCNSMGVEHNDQNLSFARQMLLINAKAFQIDAIDTVNIDLKNDNTFIQDCINSFRSGFNAKFIIHPHQQELLKETQYYSDEEIAEAEKVYSQILSIKDGQTALIKIDGKIYEKPHVNRIINIINWKNKYGNK